MPHFVRLAAQAPRERIVVVQQIAVHIRGYDQRGNCIYSRYEVSLHMPEDLSKDVAKRIEAFRAAMPEVVRLTWDVAI